MPISMRRLHHSFETWRRAHGAPVAPVACPVAMLSTWGSSPCSQQLGIMISINYFFRPSTSCLTFSLSRARSKRQVQTHCERCSSKPLRPAKSHYPIPAVTLCCWCSFQHGVARDACVCGSGGTSSGIVASPLLGLYFFGFLVLPFNASADLPFLCSRVKKKN